AGSTVSQAWDAPWWLSRRKILRSFADGIRPIPRQWTTNVHGDVLASFARQRQHRHLCPGDGDSCLSGLRHLYPRIQRCCLADTNRGDGLRPSSRPCADRDTHHFRRSLRRGRGAAASPVDTSHTSSLRRDRASWWISELPSSRRRWPSSKKLWRQQRTFN